MWSLFLSLSLSCEILFSLFSSPPVGDAGSVDLMLLDSDGRLGVSAAWAALKSALYLTLSDIDGHLLSTALASPVLWAVVARTVLSAILE
jgi:hypothetical protein